jgi:serine/threonine-protein kinase
MSKMDRKKTGIEKSKFLQILKAISAPFKKSSQPKTVSIVDRKMVSDEDPYARLLQLRELLGDKYQFIEHLGCGGFASVYKVKNLDLSRTEALKVLLDKQDTPADFSERFTQEAKVLASLDHPNIVQIYDFGHHEGTFWFSMHYIEGPTLKHELKTRGAFDEVTASRLVLPLLDALDYSHKRGVIHRDIKPGNIMLDAQGRPYLMDFGLAKPIGSMLKTRTGRFLGTPIYVSPEQASALPLDGRADIYAMGVTLYEMLTGKFPFPAEDPVQAVVLRLTNEPTPLCEIRPDVDPVFESIVMRALQKDRDKRFSSAAEMSKNLLDFLCEEEGDERSPEFVSWSLGLSQRDSTTPMENVKNAATTALPGDDNTVANRMPMLRRVAFAALFVILVTAGMILIMSGGDSRPPKDSEVKLSESAGSAHPEKPRESLMTAGSKAAENKTAVTAKEENKRPEISAKSISKPAPKSVSKPVVKQCVEQRSTKPDLLPGRPVQPPSLKKKIEPNYSGVLSENCIGVTVSLSLVIGKDGRVLKAKIISNHPSECEEAIKAVRAAVLQYIYEPAVDVEGNPVKARIAISVEIKGV